MEIKMFITLTPGLEGSHNPPGRRHCGHEQPVASALVNIGRNRHLHSQVGSACHLVSIKGVVVGSNPFDSDYCCLFVLQGNLIFK